MRNSRSSIESLNRRTWIKRAAVAAAGLAVGARSAQSQISPELGQNRYPELKYINLAGNENPFGPSRAVSLAIMKEVSNSCRYPFREEKVLKEMLAEVEGVDVDHIVLGNGCDEILSLTGDVYGRPGSTIVATRPTYLQLMHYAERRGSTIRWIDHDSEMRHDLGAMANAIDGSTSLAYICNPDTPTGTILPPESIEQFCRRVAGESTIFVDEVYLDLLDDFFSFFFASSPSPSSSSSNPSPTETVPCIKSVNRFLMSFFRFLSTFAHP